MLSEKKNTSSASRLDTGNEKLLKKGLWLRASGAGGLLIGIMLTSFLAGKALLFAGSRIGLFVQGDGALQFAGSDAARQVLNILSYIPMMTLPVLIYALFTRTHVSEAVCLCRPRKGTFFYSLFMGVGVCIVMQVAVSLLTVALGFAGIELTMPEIEIPRTLLGQAFYLLYLGIIPAFLEEMAFRGVILHSFRRYGDGFAVVVSAVLFGLIHGNPTQMLFAFVLGLVLGFFRLQTGSLWAGIGIHMMNNLLSCGLSIAALYLPEEKLGAVMLGSYALFALLGAIALLLTISNDRELLHPVGWNSCSISRGGRAVRFFLSPGLLLAAAYFIWTAAQYVRVI